MKLRTGIKHLSLSLLCSRNSHIICPQFLDSISLTRTQCVWISARVEWWGWWRPQYEVITAGICYSDFHQAHPINSVVNNHWSVTSADHRQVCYISEIRNCCYVNDRRYSYVTITIITLALIQTSWSEWRWLIHIRWLTITQYVIRKSEIKKWLLLYTSVY